MNYGARSVMNLVKTLAVQILAEAQVRGDIGKKCVAYFFYQSNIPNNIFCQQLASSFVY